MKRILKTAKEAMERLLDDVNALLSGRTSPPKLARAPVEKRQRPQQPRGRAR